MRSATHKKTDFEVELERIDRDISELEEHALAPPVESQRATKFAYRLYQRASLTGILEELKAAGSAIESAIRLIGPAPDLYFLKANLDFTLHRISDARRDIETAPGLRDSYQGKALLADLDLQEGKYEAAREGYESVIREAPTWDNLARLAYLKSRMGDTAAAERLYFEAEDELTAKEMRSFAWVELQRGLLDLRCGRHQDARAHYERADRAYSGYWLVQEHMAELSGAQGKFDEA
ncbi:MAG TPA: hypothetical protein VKC34_13320, partial [Blastocatellia bacterium]|nr:hypothetical protein [Blastocatellia bacterium]